MIREILRRLFYTDNKLDAEVVFVVFCMVMFAAGFWITKGLGAGYHY